ncbi:hypothetical protein E2P64_02570 [Candidatus Bathyarchaeota archaeon]|nr:hypothetical protein E2P64_02570 [Candidatus Bathyarchaeota archaeon]
MSISEINRKMKLDTKNYLEPLFLEDLLKYRSNLSDIRDDPQVYNAHFHLRNWTTDSKLLMINTVLKNKGYGKDVIVEADRIACQKGHQYATVEDIKEATKSVSKKNS